MFKPLHLVPHGTKINFMWPHKITFLISVLMIVGSFVLVFTKGLNFGIDFAGGVIMEVKAPTAQADLGDMRNKLDGLELGEIALQEFGSPDIVLIRIPQQDATETATQEQTTQAAVTKVKETLGSDWQYRRTETVGPKVGDELKSSAVWASIFAMLGIMAYIWFRYEWQFGINAVLALFHDCVTTVGFFALTGMEFNLTTVAAVLTIAGYSVNDTVVIYDRIRYDLRRYKTMPLAQLINQALNETLARTTVTSGLTLLSVLALAFWGGEAMHGFSVAMIWGIVIGTYSTICVASPMLLYMNLRNIGSDKGKAATTTVQKA
ncbi:protein translocase subunit SecF [Dongia rigui]|uniref:Protein-export membrane protein SecF n=1 Tax=Dongia rigui TaxID=940149 RepID=A0ABU5DSW2_9PROT|nr:protein translocase subunit SecF [Dongia rigui]MDY0870456.1 protein translocase subunit SecF [Dongia rigui]